MSQEQYDNTVQSCEERASSKRSMADWLRATDDMWRSSHGKRKLFRSDQHVSLEDGDVDKYRKLQDEQADCGRHLAREVVKDEMMEWRFLEQRWRWLKEHHKPPSATPRKEHWAIYEVSQHFNLMPLSIKSFLCIAPNSYVASCLHPCSNHSCVTYNRSTVERHREWLDYEYGIGPAPPWFLGSADPWVHATFTSTRRISYLSPMPKDPREQILSITYM